MLASEVMSLPSSFGYAAVLLVCLAGCTAVPPSGKPAPASALPVAHVSMSAPTASPSASASSGVAAAVTDSAAPALPDLPAPPPLNAVSGVAAIVWVADKSAADGMRSVWIEPNGSRATVVAERKARVFVGRAELWALQTRSVHLTTPKCDDPNSECDRHPELSEPYLKSLATGKTQNPPWHDQFGPITDCNESVDVTIEGAVGTIAFARTSLSRMACGGGCFAHGQRVATFDVDTGKPMELEFPAQILASLRTRARAEIPEAAEVCGEFPAYRASASYNERGELEGAYEFGDDQDGVCNGPTCPNPVERAPWIPPQLAAWGKLPAWVTDYLAPNHASFAFMISADLAASAKKQFGRLAQ